MGCQPKVEEQAWQQEEQAWQQGEQASQQEVAEEAPDSGLYWPFDYLCECGEAFEWSRYTGFPYHQTGWSCKNADSCGVRNNRTSFRWHCKPCTANICSTCKPKPDRKVGDEDLKVLTKRG